VKPNATEFAPLTPLAPPAPTVIVYAVVGVTIELAVEIKPPAPPPPLIPPPPPAIINALTL
jgi:hypothetical protein